jgi:hypothetical protein
MNIMDKFCECENVVEVARDMKSTCMTCNGIDAYKTSKLRPENQDVKNDSENKIKDNLGAEKALIKLARHYGLKLTYKNWDDVANAIILKNNGIKIEN